MEKVLVLMATYNGGKYLQEQLDSLYSQKNVDVSILVRDDGSKDSTLSILEQNSKCQQLKWYSDGHLGVKHGFYDLMERAAQSEFKYFAFCDQDDVWDSDKLSYALEAVSHNSEELPMLYYSGQRLVDENLNLLGDHTLNKHRNLYARFILNDAAGCTEVFNRALLNRIVSYKPDYLLMHDTWLVKVCLCIGGKVYVDTQSHMKYRQHGNNVLGLRRDLKSKLKRVKHYIEEQDVEAQMRELDKGYKNEIVDEYRDIIDDILNYKCSLKSRLHLLNRKKFDFADKGVQMTYYLKIFLNKL